MRRITSCAITGVACVSMTMTAPSPITMPVFGSPSAVYAYACSESLLKLIFFSSRSACEANFFSVMEALDEADEASGTARPIVAAKSGYPASFATPQWIPARTGKTNVHRYRVNRPGDRAQILRLARLRAKRCKCGSGAVFLDQCGCPVGNPAQVCSITIAGPALGRGAARCCGRSNAYTLLDDGSCCSTGRRPRDQGQA